MLEIITKKSIHIDEIQLKRNDFSFKYYLYQGQQERKAIFIDMSNISHNDVRYLGLLSSCISLILSNLFIEQKMEVYDLTQMTSNQRIHVLLDDKSMMRYKVGTDKFFVDKGISALESISILGGEPVQITNDYLRLFDLLG